MKSLTERAGVKLKSTSRVGEGVYRFDWRLGWYSVFTWLMTALVYGLVALPWFYLFLPFTVVVTTGLYFKVVRSKSFNARFNSKTIFAQGLWLGGFLFVVTFSMDLVEFVGLDINNLYIYLLDSRNFLKFPVIILIPAIYGLYLENQFKKSHKEYVPGDFSVEATVLN